jgi:pimeloyl-ACP methyl ester carboxylesterase
MERIHYDEFGLFHENAAEYGLAYDRPPAVTRHSVALSDGRQLSALRWGVGVERPPLVFVHGGSQNAHTWDTTLMALDRPAIAIDLPGHGHSDWRDDGDYSPRSMADDVAEAIRSLATASATVVGMSLGGLTSMSLAANHPTLVGSLVMVDITPGVTGAKAKAVLDFVNGPQVFPSFEALLARTIEHNPTRSETSLRRGILHNARQLDDGSWQWRYDRRGHGRPAEGDAGAEGAGPVRTTGLWDEFERVSCPVALVRGGLSPVVDDDDVDEARRRQPGIVVDVIDGAGHSIQGDRPLELAALLRRLIG